MTHCKQTLINSKSTDVDYLVGQKLRMRRLMLGISQYDLAQAVNVSTQQIQKYENAINRISSGKLYEIAEYLKTSINYFFYRKNSIENQNPIYAFKEDGEALDFPNTNSKDQNPSEKSTDFVCDFFEHNSYQENDKKEIINMLKEFISIKDYKIRKSIIHLIKNINSSYV